MMVHTEYLPQLDTKEQTDRDLRKARRAKILEVVSTYADNPKVRIAVRNNMDDLASREEDNSRFSKDEIAGYLGTIDKAYVELIGNNEVDKQQLLDLTIAHQTILDSCIPLIKKYVNHRCASAHPYTRDDIIQECILVMYQSIAMYADRGTGASIYSMMYGIISHKLSDYWRKSMHNLERESLVDDLAASQGNIIADTTLEPKLEQAEARAKLLKIVEQNKIPVNHLISFCLYEGIDPAIFPELYDRIQKPPLANQKQITSEDLAKAIETMPSEGYNLTKIADILDTSPGVLRVARHRSLQKLARAADKLGMRAG